MQSNSAISTSQKWKEEKKLSVQEEKVKFCSLFKKDYQAFSYLLLRIVKWNHPLTKEHIENKKEIVNRYNSEIKNIKDSFAYKKETNIKTRKFKDILMGTNNSFFSFFTLAMLIWIIAYVFINGSKILSWDFITGPYSNHNYTLVTKQDYVLEENLDFSDIDTSKDSVSKKWGVGFRLDEKEENMYIENISVHSPFLSLVNFSDQSAVDVLQYQYRITYISLIDKEGKGITAYADDGLTSFISALDSGVKITDSSFIVDGGGIQGSLLTTITLIGLTLLFAFPLGIGGAIYLAVYAKNNKATKIIRTLIDMTSGIPSIIFGLAGALIFIPFTSSMLGTTGGNMLSGALTMTMILLPTIVKTVEESIRVIPSSIINASYALGAGKTETIFKIIIPNAIPGILTSLLLSIGRIIGESAALVFALGSTISDVVSIGGSNATLAVHIWYILGGENPAFDSACAISIIIIIIILILSVAVKLLSLFATRYKRS